ncbi:MAG: hypothetical protein A2W35_15200 [Chloroflexi bacterium RBG_16_57_11]|nr:MAG: hypothetical protein A2W35_15200 [Chloroflexi bacterium RBG_16_57_11]
MNKADPGIKRKADVSRRANWISSWRVSQVALCIGVAACIALAPAPAYASQLAPLSLAIPRAASDGGLDQPGNTPPNFLSSTEPNPDVSVEMYLPDLRTLPLSDLHIQLRSGARRYLRLTNTIWNSGQGPLELTGEFNVLTNRTRVHQHIYSSDDDRRDVLVGEFVWHPTHDHWHFDEFTLYELWTLTPDYRLGQVVASSDKLSYCVMDTDVVDPDHPRLARRQGFEGCGQRLQGLSVGWGDTYKSSLDGQALDLTGLPDGYYALTSSVNPNAMILEENYSNNSTRVYLEILGDQISPVTLKQIRQAICDQPECR